jgi:hypothetical protein
MQQKTKQSRFFQKIPKTKLLTPGGMIVLFLALTLDFLDYLLDLIGFLVWRGLHYEIINWPLKLFLDLLFGVFSSMLLGVSILNSVLPFLIEQIPVIGTLMPSWVINIIRMIL